MPEIDMTYSTARAMKEALAARKVSALELLDLHLARVKALNPVYNAVVALDEEGARERARAADEASARGHGNGPLHGIPMTIKDSFAAVGMAATCGIEELRNYRPAQDAVAVGRIRGAGAVIFGKTNLPAGAADHQSFNALFGLTLNPWNVERTVGGSSGGSAAALAAGLTPLELGSDIGGSIRVPAHFCGVYGHKSSHGLVSVEGHIPPPPGHFAEPELGVAGPLARSAADLELLLDVVLGPPAFGPGAAGIQLPPPRHHELGAFRVAVWNDDEAYPLDSSYAAAIEAFVSDLRRLGVHVDTVARPAIDPAESYAVYLQTLFAIIGAGLPPPAREAVIEAGKGAPADSYARRISDAVQQTLPQYFDLAEQRQKLFRAWRNFFVGHDVLLCPITPTVAFPHDTARADMAAQFERRIIVDGVPIPYMDNLTWPGLVTVANLPATAVPTRRLVGGLPAGIQIVGPYLGDRTTLKFAQLLDERLGGFVPPIGRTA
ncbi:amidase [Bradyrhizobium sp. KB893862 SZCCT0404]|uniref:amidase n=1 Tax=Bradyrhizobium sp. KB893862 SZCCT0404 TaxID=2807672 RepID=UPI001BA4D55E|nr:amidase [Bradyrhizobium sp. KB893862 SZCCT0404]MBR1177199.1 amidase [Bradyrhizobium sp. KB893862 SZCCT0404]